MDKVECIVVGAGPAVSACAIELARRGVKTVVLERGEQVGHKNVASFAIFGSVLSTVNDIYTGVPSCILSGVKAAETVAYAKQQRRYDAATRAKYKDFLYTTGLPKMIFNARVFSDFMAKSGMKNMGAFADKAFTEGEFIRCNPPCACSNNASMDGLSVCF